MRDRPKVLYIAAWGRSGTTIVDNILNGYDGVFSVGELRLLWRRGLVERRNCGCRTPLPECPLWAEVLRRAYRDTNQRPRRVVAMQRDAARIRHTLSLLYRPWSDDARQYADHLSRIYRAVQETTGAELIVDSTKTPAEAAIVAGLADVDAYLLHMVRDPRAVAHSWSRPTRHLDRNVLMMGHTPARSTANWLGWNALIERIAGRYAGRHMRLRYEDFVSDPQERVESVPVHAYAGRRRTVPRAAPGTPGLEPHGCRQPPTVPRRRHPHPPGRRLGPRPPWRDAARRRRARPAVPPALPVPALAATEHSRR